MQDQKSFSFRRLIFNGCPDKKTPSSNGLKAFQQGRLLKLQKLHAFKKQIGHECDLKKDLR
jgi:hypothetical protein